MPTLQPWLLIIEGIFLLLKLRAWLCAQTQKIQKASECYIIEDAMKLSTLGSLE